MTLLPLLIGAAVAGAPLRTDWLLFSVQFGVRDGLTGQLTQGGEPWRHFDEFLASLAQPKRKKIRTERRKVADAGVRFRWARGRDITPADWDVF